jgi:6-phosphogluconolactonase
MRPMSFGWVLAVVGAMALVLPVATASAGPGGGYGPSAVFTMTNAPTGNAVVAYDRAPTGALTWTGTFAAGGTGTGASLADQGALAVSNDHRWLLAVDAGSNQISVFAIGERHGSVWLQLTAVVGSGGVLPVSLTTFGPLVYVLNDGNATEPGNIAGFYLTAVGGLAPLPGSVQPLSGPAATGAAEISFDPVPGALVVTEKATNLIDVYLLGPGGRALPPSTHPSQGGTPYGFAVAPNGAILVSEASTGSLSSYRISPWEGWSVISSSVPDSQAAPCWVVTADHGTVAYTTNADSNTISAYGVSRSGSLVLSDEVAATTGATPTDLAVDSDGALLYVRDAGAGTIQAFWIGPGGSLLSAGSVGGLPSSAEGLIAL